MSSRFGIEKKHYPILIFGWIYLIIFFFLYLQRANYEFLMYIGIMLLLFLVILFTNKKVRLDNFILWGLVIWGLLHMAGGYFIVGKYVLYGYWIIPDFLRFDMLVHAFGFGLCTLIGYHLLKPYLKENIKKFGLISLLLVLIGMGFGALNEIVEFIMVISLPQTGVGGYENTLWDMVFNTMGAIIAVVLINVRRKLKNIKNNR